MRIYLSHAQANPDLRFRPIAKRRRLELAFAFATHAAEPDLAIPHDYPYVEPHLLHSEMNTDGLEEKWVLAEQRVAAEVFGREVELLMNWQFLKAEIGDRRIRGFTDVARYYFDRPFSRLVHKAVQPPQCTSCLRHCDWGVEDCCCIPRATFESRSPCGFDCMWCQLYPRSVGPLHTWKERPLMQMVYE